MPVVRVPGRAVAVALSAFLLTATLSTVLAPAPAFAAPDRREMKAREAFAAGRYQEALDIYAKLYAEQLHPNYLRNIGRCYQDLGQPDQAISSFREYLRKAKGISADERKEIDGFIAEMEELKRKSEGKTEPKTEPAKEASKNGVTPPPPADERPVAPVAVNAAAPPSAVSPSPSPAVVLVAPSPEEPRRNDQASPIYTRWWFWTLAGLVVVGGLGGAAAAGVFTSKTDAACSTGRICR